MKVNAGQIERALDSPSENIRLYLLYGPDEAGSRAQAKRLQRAMGSGAERVDLDSATLKGDPARLADEAASTSLFGEKRYIRLMLSGDEAMSAIEALLDAPAAGNPVVAIAGALKPTSALLKRAVVDNAVMACANYPLEGENADRLAIAIASGLGLRLSPDVARAIVEAAAGDRAVMEQEIEKMALFLDAAPQRPADADIIAFEAISAGNGEGELARLIDAVMDGNPALVAQEMAVLAEEGVDGIALIRALIKRVQLLTRFAAEVAAGQSVENVIERAGKSLFWKEKAPVQRQLKRWTPQRLATAADRLLSAERAIKASGSAGAIFAASELITLARVAQRRG
jgi:DNA polymerase III subunit delta